MKCLVSLLLLSVSLTGCESGVRGFHPSDGLNSSHIIGGEEVKGRQSPFDSVVFLVQPGEQKPKSVCTGTAIAKDVVLTAGHCASDYTLDRISGAMEAKPAENLHVYFGNEISLIPPSSAPIMVSQILVHPGFLRSKTWGGDGFVDLAVIKLSEPLPVGYNSALLLSAPEKLPTEVFLLAGFGSHLSAFQPRPDNFRLRSTRLVGLQAEPYTWGATSPVFFLDQSNGKGACVGDSGGPAFVATPQGFQLSGVASFVKNPKGEEPCAYVSGYTSLFYYRDWITSALTSLE